MKVLISGLIALAIAVVLVALTHNDPGYVLITYRQWTIESSLAFLIIALSVCFVALYYALRLWGGALSLPGRQRRWRKRRRASRARRALTDGMLELAEGNWQTAERTLLRNVRDSKTPVLNYLAAARAAQEQGELDRRDAYLRHAQGGLLASELAVGLTQASLYLSAHQPDQAAAVLKQLYSVSPRNNHVLRMLSEVYSEQRDWNHFLELLPELRRRRIYAKEKTDELEQSAYTTLLEEVIRQKESAALQNFWQGIPPSVRNQERLICIYVHGLLSINPDVDHDIETLLYEGVNRHGSDALIHLYGLIKTSNSTAQLARAEKWLKHQPRNPLLLLTLGRLAQRSQLWGKARSYLEASIGITPHVETYYELGTLLERLNDDEGALEYYRVAAKLAEKSAPNYTPAIAGYAASRTIPLLAGSSVKRG